LSRQGTDTFLREGANNNNNSNKEENTNKKYNIKQYQHVRNKSTTNQTKQQHTNNNTPFGVNDVL